MQINIVSVSQEDRGKYQMLEVIYKSDGKVSNKKLMSFNYPEVFQTLKKAKPNDSFEVKTAKNDKNFWDWISITEAGAAAPSNSGGNQVVNASPRSTYETPEERAFRQVLIVRQSSVSNAIEHLKLNTKKIPTVEEVIQVAKQFEDYVYSRTSSNAAGLNELVDDVI